MWHVWFFLVDEALNMFGYFGHEELRILALLGPICIDFRVVFVAFSG